MNNIDENILHLAEDKDDEENLDFRDLSNQKIYTEPKQWTISVLFDKFKKGNINLQPDFQRHFVWDKKKASALIESILLKFPLPIIYLSEEENGKLTVIDGQQRLTSIFSFLDNKFPSGGDFKLSSLKVLKDLNNMKKTYITPEIETFVLNAPVLMQSTSDIQSGGNDEGDGVAESKTFYGNTVFDENLFDEE